MIHKYPDKQQRTALFAGSFNPFTKGHLSILERGLELFDRVVVSVGVNGEKDARADVAALQSLLAELYPRVEVMEWSGLTVDAARSVGARWLLRGARTAADFEYERNLADINRDIAGVDTVILPTEPQLAMVSSSMVRELKRFGHDVSKYLP